MQNKFRYFNLKEKEIDINNMIILVYLLYYNIYNKGYFKIKVFIETYHDNS